MISKQPWPVDCDFDDYNNDDDDNGGGGGGEDDNGGGGGGDDDEGVEEEGEEEGEAESRRRSRGRRRMWGIEGGGVQTRFLITQATFRVLWVSMKDQEGPREQVQRANKQARSYFIWQRVYYLCDNPVYSVLVNVATHACSLSLMCDVLCDFCRSRLT